MFHSAVRTNTPKTVKAIVKSTLRTAVVVLMSGSLLGCANNEDASRSVGSVIGAVVGGILGAKLGKGAGRAASVALGVGLGGLMGDELARQMTMRDREMASENLQNTLEDGEPGQPAPWSNPDSGNSGQAVAAGGFTQASSDCRNFETTVFTDEGEHVATGTACRNDDGSWQVVSEPEAG